MKATISKKPKNKIVILAVALLSILIISLMILTRAGAIPNVFNIEFLCPNSNKQSDEVYTPDDSSTYRLDKPVIYLYPQIITDINVKLDFSGTLMTTYPQYDNSIGGWQVTAKPDGQLINKTDGKIYSYLFWDGKLDIKWDISKGFMVKGEDTAKFLQEKLAAIGLTPKEYNEFIVYWLPQMKYNKYNLISFIGNQYTDSAKLTITPKPDSTLRVFMVFKSLDKPISIESQTIQPFERKGFTVVEWGGSEIK